MDEEQAGEDEKRRAPLSRSRRLSSRRRRKTEDEENSDDEAGSTDTPAEDAAGDTAPTPAVEAAVAEEDFTQAVSFSASASQAEDSFPYTPPLPGERWASLVGAARRFLQDFSSFILGASRTASQHGQAFGRDVVKPFSSALLEAALYLALLFAIGACGAYLGRFLKIAALGEASLPAARQGVVRDPGQGIDESSFGEGFSTEEINSRANRVLQSYLTAIQESNFRAAYDLLSPAWRKELPFESFEKGYSLTRVIGYEIGKAETVKPMQVKIRADIRVDENGKIRRLRAAYVAVLTSNGWRLDEGTFESQ